MKKLIDLMENSNIIKSSIHILLIVLLFSLVYLIKVASGVNSEDEVQLGTVKTSNSNIYGQLPLIIEENLGQLPEDINYFARKGGYEIHLNPDNFILNARKSSQSSVNQIKFEFLDSNPNSTLADQTLLQSKSNYFRGKDRSNWIVDVPNFESIQYNNIYNGIDLKYYSKKGNLQYDFIVSPNTDPNIIKVKVVGVDRISTNDKNNLELHFSDGMIELEDLLAYQEVNNQIKTIESNYSIYESNEFGFSLGKYDKNLPLIIDPVVEYSTYLGGNGSDQGNEIVVDDVGHAYIIGQTSSTNFPTSTGAFDEVGRKGGFFDPADVFVMKLNSEGSGYIYSTYISGGDSDIGHGISIDSSGNAYIVGSTSSIDNVETPEIDEGFPLVNPYQNFYGGDGDLFVAKLNSSGNDLLFSTYFGGESNDYTGQDKPGIDIDNSGNIYFSGTTMSLEFPTTSGVFQETGPGPFVAKMSNDGSSLLYSTFLGGDEFVFISDLVVSDIGKAHITGFTANPDLPTTVNAYQPNPNNGEEAFFYKLNLDGTGFDICSYFGGSEDDFAYGIALDNSNNIYITGNTFSNVDFPLTTGSILPSGSSYAAKINSSSNTLVYSLPLSGDVGNDIAVDYADRASIVGNYFDGSSSDVVFSVVNSAGNGNIHETFLGGLFQDVGTAIDVDEEGNAYLTGATSSSGFPGQTVVNQNPLLSDLSSPPDGFVAKIDMEYGPVESPYLSRDEAINIFLAEYLEINPRSDSIAAYLYNKIEEDSLLAPGDMVSFYDSNFTLNINEPSYLFWVDQYPNMEFYHPTSMAIMNAVTGAFLVYDALTWPILNGIELTEFAAANILSPNIFFGANLFFGIPPRITYTSVPRENDQDWAIVLVSRNLSKDENKFRGEKERRARINDIARVKEILNGAPLGPKLKDENIIVLPGADTTGATKQQICDAIDSLKGKACNKLYFFYLGHGSKKGAMILRDGNFKYSELRVKLANTQAKEFCISIEACYSGKAIKELSKGTKVGGKTRYLNGKIITSSPGTRTTKREADGTPFYKGLNECYKDEFADLNKSGDIDFFEALAWAVALNGKVEDDQPLGKVLARGKNRHIFILSRYKYKEGSKISRKLRGLCFELISGRYKPIGDKEVDKDKLDKKGYYNRVALYVENKTRRHIRKKVEVKCTSGGKRTKMEVTIDLPPRDRDVKKKLPRQCLTELPMGCKNFDVKVLDDSRALDKFADNEFPDTFMVPVSYSPGEFIFEPIIIDSTVGDVYATSVSGQNEWGLSINPAQFTYSSIVDSEVVIVNGDIPVNENTGESFFATIDNMTSGKTEVFHYNLILDDTSDVLISGSQLIENKLLYLKNDINLTSGNLEINNSIIVFPDQSSIQLNSGSVFKTFNAVFTSDSLGEYGASLSGEINIDRTNFNTPLEGVTLDSPIGEIYESSIYGSEDDGLKIYNDQSNLNINFLFITSSAKSGIYFENATNSVLRNTTVSNSIENDLTLNQGSNVMMIDSQFDSNKVTVDETSTLTRKWSNSMSFLDGDNNPILGAVVSITNLTNSSTVVDTTDSLGLTRINELTHYIQNGNTKIYQTPHTVNFSYGGFDTTFSITASSMESIEFTIGKILTDVNNSNLLPNEYSISQNYPNPFNPSTNIKYSLPISDKVQIVVYDILGNVVEVLVDGIKEEGYHEIIFDASDISSGIYFYRLQAGNFVETKKMILLK